MDRRFLIWLLLSASLFFAYTSLQRRFIPEPPAKNLAGELAKQAEDPAKAADADLKASDQPDLKKAADEPAKAGEKQPRPYFPDRVLSLGSMDPTKGYHLLATISSRGAGIEHIELVEQTKPGRYRYRALEHTGGYLGYLGLRPTSDGLKITSVPHGSPASLANCATVAGGLVAGDVLKSFNAQPTSSLDKLHKLLNDAKVGSKAVLEIVRETGDDPATLKFTASLSQVPLDVLRTQEHPAEQVVGNEHRSSCLTTLAALNSARIPVNQRSMAGLAATLTDNWEVLPLDVPGGEGIEFRLPLDSYLDDPALPKELDLVKRYRLLPAGGKPGQAIPGKTDGFSLDLETLVVNRSDQPIDVALRQEGLSGLTLEGWWYSVKISPYFFRGAGSRDVVYSTIASGHNIRLNREIFDAAIETPKAPDRTLFGPGESVEARTLRHIGVDSQYFAAALLPHPDHSGGLSDLYQAGTTALADVQAIPKAQAQGTNVSFWFDTNSKTVAPGESISHRYRIFAGPKDTDLLTGYGLDRFIEYGWFPLVAKPLSLILHFFYSIVRNYGLSIMMLTVVVRACMFPLGRQAAINAQRMQELQPEMKKINDLYKDNMEKRAKAMQDLYRKHNFRPLSGCLPMFIQIPIFIGLYRCLSVDISLRQQALIPGLQWCSNLAGPDLLMDWSSWMPQFIAGRGSGWLGPYFNILPVVTVVLFLVQQKILMPKATDEQTRMTQNMMQYMTIFMAVLFFKVPSGLCIYFVTSSLWSLVERKLVKRLIPPLTPLSASSAPTEPSGNSPKPLATPNRSTKTTAGGAVSSPPKNRSEIRQAAAREAAKPLSRLEEFKKMLEKPAVRSATQRNVDKKKRRRR